MSTKTFKWKSYQFEQKKKTPFPGQSMLVNNGSMEIKNWTKREIIIQRVFCDIKFISGDLLSI